jgi:hypothetical protein
MTTLKAIKMFGVFPGQWLRETMKIALKLTPMRHGGNRYSLLRRGLDLAITTLKLHLFTPCRFWPALSGRPLFTRIDIDKVNLESRFDGKWVLTTNTDLAADKVALKYKELWQVERVFRDVKSILGTRPVYHQHLGMVMISFLCLSLWAIMVPLS